MIKKLILTGFAITLLSCGRGTDDVTPTDNTPILITKMNYFDNSGNSGGTRVFTYSGDKIVKEETTDGEKAEFTYTGDDITKTVLYLNGQIDEINEYFYTNGKLTSQKITSTSHPNYNQTITYNYINDNYVKFTKVTGYGISNGVTTLYYTNYDVYLSNGLFNKVVSTANNSGTTTYTYTYDDKNNPYKNIRGYVKAKMFDSMDGINAMNNLTKSNFTQIFGSNTYNSSDTYSYTYNTNNFPTKVIESFYSQYGTISDVVTFEYNK